jgi:hypothetical protein
MSAGAGPDKCGAPDKYCAGDSALFRQQFLYFLPLPQLQGSFLPSLMLASLINSFPM